MSEKIQYAGEVNFDTLEILTSSGLKLDILDITVSIDIFEDIFKNTITGSLVIGDTENILSNFKIVGQELLRLKFRTPGLTEKSDILDFTTNPFFINKIATRMSTTSGGQIYELQFTSQESMRNQTVRVSKSYKDSIQNIVLDCMSNETFIATNKDLYVDATLGSRKIVAPNLHPYTLIDKLKRESISKSDGSTEFLFFENKDGFYFTSLSTLYKEPVRALFHDGDKALSENKSSTKSTTDNEIIQSLRRIISYDILDSKDFTINLVGGMLGGELTTHNIYNKSYQTTSYSYFDNFQDHPRINGTDSKTVYSDEIIKTLNSFDKTSIKVHPTSSVNNLDAQHYEDGNTVYSTNKAEDWLLHRQSRITELNNSSFINMKVHGITNLKVGDIIEANFPVVGNDHNNYKLEPFLSGTYLISKLRHTFSPITKAHEINMQIVRDCGTIEI